MYHLTFSKLVPLNLSHKGERKVEIYRFLTAIHQTGSKKFHSITFLPHGSADANCYIIYDPKLRDDTKLPKITIFGFEPEYRWTESYPIEPPRPTNYTRPDLENSAPKIVYPMDSPNAYKFHLMHLNLEYSDRLKTANRSWY